MLFYKVRGSVTNSIINDDNDLSKRYEKARKLSAKSNDFNQEHGGGTFVFPANYFGSVMNIGIISDNSENIEKTLESYLNFIEIELKDIVITEITISAIKNLLKTAYKENYISDNDEIMERFCIDVVTGRNRCIDYTENVIEIKDKGDIYSSAKELLLSETLISELDRIYAGTKVSRVCGHPVHYLIQTDDENTRRQTYKILLQALYANNRLSSKRYCFMEYKRTQNFSFYSYDTLYKVCKGGAIIIFFRVNNDSDQGDSIFASIENYAIEKLCEVAKRYRNEVLTILCLPRVCKSAKDVFYENLGTMSFMELQENFVSDERAVSFLKMLAKKNNIEADEDLLSKPQKEVGYLSQDLQRIFTEWYNVKLKTYIYPQYKNFAAVNREIIKAAPKGGAYDELREMIGLRDAKAIIQKAINYYKIQNLYEEKGLKKDNPMMHMAFYGNPGTAKTTVARLFARIMKDNGLLSKGHIVEVGREDLVGRFVGWTAKAVKSIFNSALGGVLFIDEAYSLVEYHKGSFGDEAINTIVQEMENHRENVVVIFAGYPDKMEEFIQRNPGLRSRIAFHIPFADYNTEELCEIATLIGKEKGVTFDNEAMDKLKSVFEAARKQSDFGNGRYVRNIIEQAKMSQASRLLQYDLDSISVREFSTIKAADIDIPDFGVITKRKIGFAR